MEKREQQIKRIIDDLKVFISNKNHIGQANKIETALDNIFPDDDYVQSFVVDLAQYNPSGGDYLYNFEEILPKAKAVLSWLESK